MGAKLIYRNLLAHPLRSLLTLMTLVVAVFLLIFLKSLLIALSAGVEGASSTRVIVQSAVSLFVDLPLAYQSKIEAVDGVETTCKLNWFGGFYQDPSNFFAQFGVDPDRYFLCYPEVEIVVGSKEEFLTTRTSCIVGKALADRFGWKVGDTIPIMGTIYPHPSGGAWEFRVAAIFRSKVSGAVDEGTLFFHYENLREALAAVGREEEVNVGVYVVRMAPGTDTTRMMRDIDALFDGGPQRVQATTEAEFNRQFVSMLGNVPTFLSAIGGGVLFAIALAALNTMLMAGRERTHDIGIMKALGFSGLRIFGLLMIESLLLCGGGGLVGVAIAKGIEPAFAAFLSSQFPGFAVSPETVALGLGASLAIGLVAGFVPAWNAARMRPITALRQEA